MDHKLSVLADHCKTYDTDYGAIQKSWFTRCIVRETEAEVEAMLDDAPMFREENLDESEHHLVGTPEEIVADIRRYASLGIDEVVVEFVDFSGTDGAELFANEVIPAFE